MRILRKEIAHGTYAIINQSLQNQRSKCRMKKRNAILGNKNKKALLARIVFALEIILAIVFIVLLAINIVNGTPILFVLFYVLYISIHTFWLGMDFQKAIAQKRFKLDDNNDEASTKVQE